jgi:hypothetical protein
MDHLIALRQEVAALRQETDAKAEMAQLAQVIQANSNVVEACRPSCRHNLSDVSTNIQSEVQRIVRASQAPAAVKMTHDRY